MRRIKRRFSRAWAIVLGLALVLPYGVSAAGGGGNDGKVTVNHKGKLIRVGPVAATYHVLIHGDSIPGEEPPPPPDSGGGY